MKSSELLPNQYAPFYAPYIDALNNADLLEELEISMADFIKFVREIPLGKHDYRYAEGKWTIKQIIRHIIDSERIFAYRAVRFARKDNTELPGFDQDIFVGNVDVERSNIQELLTEFSAVRYASLLLFKTFDQEQLNAVGVASGNPISVAALGFIIIGHQKHHQQVFTERYLN